jgi:hypothetical protein
LAIVAALSLVFLHVPACARAAGPPVTTSVDAPCIHVRGYIVDSDPNGSNVRSGPRIDAAVVSHVPPLSAPGPKPHDPHETKLGANFEVLGSHDGWFLVRGIRQLSVNGYTWAGPGWIAAGLVGFSLASRTLRASPSASAPVLETLAGTPTHPAAFEIVRAYGCRGTWVDALVKDELARGSAAKRGWVGVCGLQLNECEDKRP